MSEWVELKRFALPRIEAFLKDGTCQLYTPQMLDLMLERNQVSQFKRSSGWVIVGIDPIRSKRGDCVFSGYHGPDRRASSVGGPQPIL